MFLTAFVHAALVSDGCKRNGESSESQWIKREFTQLAFVPPGATEKTIATRCCKGRNRELKCTSKYDDDKSCLPEDVPWSQAAEACASLVQDGGGWRLCSEEELQHPEGATGDKLGPCCGTGCSFSNRYVWTRTAPGEGDTFTCCLSDQRNEFKILTCRFVMHLWAANFSSQVR